MSRSAKQKNGKTGADAFGGAEFTSTANAPIAQTGNGRPGAKGNSGDTIYRMSKKIAQLTKVVYYLNTKHEDHVVETSSLAKVYEEEISDIITEATLKINDLHERVEVSEALSQKHLTASEDYAEYRGTAEAKYAELEVDFKRGEETQEGLQRQIENITEAAAEASKQNANDMRTLKEGLEEQITQLSNEKETQRLLYEAEIDTLKEKHAQDLQDLLHERKLVEDRFDEERSEFERNLENVRADHAEELEQVIRVNEDKVVEIEEAARKEAMIMESKLEEEEQKVKENREVIQKLQEDLEMKSKEITRHVSTFNEIQQAMSNKMAQIRAMTGTHEKSLNEIVLLREQVAKTERNLETVQQRFNAEHESVVRITAESAVSREKIFDLEAKSQKLEGELANATRERDQFELELKELESFKDKLDAVRAEKEIIRAQLTNEIAIQKNAAAENLREQLKSQKEQLLKQTTDERNASEARITKDYEDRIEKLRQIIENVNTEMARQGAAAAATLSQLKKRHADEKQNLESTIRSLEEYRDHLLNEIKEIKLEIADSHKEIDRLNRTVKSMGSEIDGLELDKADLIQKMIQHDRSVRMELEAKFTKQAEENLKSMQLQQQKETRTALAAMESDFKRDLNEAQIQTSTKYILEMKKIEATFEGEREQFELRQQDLREVLLAKDDRLLEADERLTGLIKSHKEELASFAVQQEDNLQGLRKTVEAESVARETQIKVEHSIFLAKVEAKHQQALAAAATAAKKEMEELRNFNRVSSTAMKKELDSQRVAEVHRITSDYDQIIQTLKNEHEQEVLRINVDQNLRREQELKQLEDNCAVLVEQKESEISELQKQISDHLESFTQLKEHISDLKLEIIEVEKTSNAQSVAHDIARKQAKELLEKVQAELEERRQMDIKILQEQHLAEARSMLTEFEQAQAFLKRQINAQSKKLDDADVKYEHREPRDVDVRRIADLEEEMRRKKRKIHTLTEEIERYKLELNNREDNLNRMFNSKPHVGVMQPLEMLSKKSKRTDTRGDTAGLLSRLPPLYTAQTQSMNHTFSSTSSLSSQKSHHNIAPPPSVVPAPATAAAVLQQ